MIPISTHGTEWMIEDAIRTMSTHLRTIGDWNAAHNGSNVRIFFVNIAEKVRADSENLIKWRLVLPLRLFSAFHRLEFDLCVRNSTHLIMVLAESGYRENAYCRLLPLFVFIQTSSCFYHDKNGFLMKVASVFGLVEEGFETEAIGNLYFVFVFFVSCLATDKHRETP
jgi:hypothetical protein